MLRKAQAKKLQRSAGLSIACSRHRRRGRRLTRSARRPGSCRRPAPARATASTPAALRTNQSTNTRLAHAPRWQGMELQRVRTEHFFADIEHVWRDVQHCNNGQKEQGLRPSSGLRKSVAVSRSRTRVDCGEQEPDEDRQEEEQPGQPVPRDRFCVHEESPNQRVVTRKKQRNLLAYAASS